MRDVETSSLVLLAISGVYISFNLWAMSNLARVAPEFSTVFPQMESSSTGSTLHLVPHSAIPAKNIKPHTPIEVGAAAAAPQVPQAEDLEKLPQFHPHKWKPRIMAVVPMNWPPRKTPRIEQHFKAILDTWGGHADILKFLVGKKALEADPPTSDSYAWIPKEVRETHLLGVPMDRDDTPKSRNIWEKMWRTWNLVGKEYLDKADFFCKVDIDAFLIVENLRVYASYLNPDDPWYMGHTLYSRWGIQNLVYNSGTTYCMSREAVRQLSIRLDYIETTCDKCGGSQCLDRGGAGEDPQTGGCLRDLNILPADTLDSRGRQRFLPFRPRDHLFDVPYKADNKDWFWAYKGKMAQKQILKDCCSPYPISFHNFKTDPAAIYDKDALYELEYFFHSAPYESRIIGIDPPSGNLYQYDVAALDFQIDESTRDKRSHAKNEEIGLWLKENADKIKKK
mmetsp:Transcript_27360/g.48373  ORF Transcript_27360/g.48373 Transcript_27360/m.48373 type:complete len:451 (+) Transcript_27360:215-1567(+)